MGLPTGAQSPRPLGVLTCQRRYGHALTKTVQMFDRLGVVVATIARISSKTMRFGLT